MGRRTWIVLVAALAGAGCASPRRSLGSAAAERPHARAGARAEFEPPRFHDIFALAVDLVRRRGLEIAQCEAPRGSLATVPVELDAPCGGTTCLARENLRVKLGYRRARVTLTREVWDPTIRGWREQDDPSTVEELAREEREIVARMMEAPGTARAGRRPRIDPCAPPPCAGGACVAVRAVLPQ
jgi:hypothetical protein